MKQTPLHLGQLSGRARRQVACVRPAAAPSWRPAADSSYAVRTTGVVVLTHSGNATNATTAANSGFMGTDPVAIKRPARHLATRST